MISKEQRIQRISNQILDIEEQLKLKKKWLPLKVLGGIAASFVIPFIPTRRSRTQLITVFEYSYIVCFFIILSVIIIIGGYNDQKNRSKKKIRDFRLKKYLIEKENT